MTPEERRATLDAIASEIRVCDRCRLSGQRTHAVPGEGNPDTEVVFVGEGPGQNEDRQGRPFVGAAGELLEELLAMLDWRREDVFITNVVKCRPPGNRDPEADEIAACQPYLRRQLAALDPAMVVTLGRHSLQSFRPDDRISRVHGTMRPVDPASGAQSAVGYAMYHPAAALRQAALRETMQRDMAAIPAALIAARQARTAGHAPPPSPAEGTAAGTGADVPGGGWIDGPDFGAPSAELRPGEPPLGPADDQLGLF